MQYNQFKINRFKFKSEAMTKWKYSKKTCNENDNEWTNIRPYQMHQCVGYIELENTKTHNMYAGCRYMKKVIRAEVNLYILQTYSSLR